MTTSTCAGANGLSLPTCRDGLRLMHPLGREVAFATKSDARLARALAIFVAVSALVVTGVPLFTPVPWLALLAALAGILLLALAVGLWVSETDDAANTVRSQTQGVQGAAELCELDEIGHESLGYGITARVRVEGMDPFDVVHVCSH